MDANRRMVVSVATVLVLAAACALDSARTHRWSLTVLAGVSILVTLGLLALVRDRRLVRLRADLATWVTSTTAATGEPPERLIDRALSTYRAQLDGTRDQPTHADERDR
jgi:hypothetical protein